MMRGEALDVATPLLANLHNRFEDQDLWGWERAGEGPLIRFGQEVRSHFLGHVGLIGIGDFFWPWVWGPGYQVYGTDDRENAEALGHARSRGGFGYYVHPVSVSGAERARPWSEVPFGNLSPSVPIELVADAVLGDLDALEVVCLWSDETATTQVWHRFLNLGIPVAPSAGTDVMNNFFRTMAVGTTRVYAMTGGQLNWPAYMAALREGRTFVTNGPFPDFRLAGAGPGGVVAAGSASWTLDLSSASGVERVEVLVNGEVAWQSGGLDGPGFLRYEGTLDLPEGGWVAVRAVGGNTEWPSMASYPFAHTAPIWIGEVGSTEPGARARAASPCSKGGRLLPCTPAPAPGPRSAGPAPRGGPACSPAAPDIRRRPSGPPPPNWPRCCASRETASSSVTETPTFRTCWPASTGQGRSWRSGPGPSRPGASPLSVHGRIHPRTAG